MNIEDIEFTVKETAGVSTYRAEFSALVEHSTNVQDMTVIKLRQPLEAEIQEKMANEIFRKMYEEQWEIQSRIAALCKQRMNDLTGDEMEFMNALAALLVELRQSTLP